MDALTARAVEVRAATTGDAVAIAELIAGLGYEVAAADVPARLSALPAGHAVFVAEDDAVVGYVHVHVDPSLVSGRRAQLGGLSLAAGTRGRGIGERLLSGAEGWAREQGCRTMWVRAGDQRDGAHRFYRARGYEDRKSQLVFTKELVPGDAPLG